MLAIPPENNVPEPDWDTANPKPREAEENESEIPQSELDSIRRRLEGLL
jgi:hypothetical protein